MTGCGCRTCQPAEDERRAVLEAEQAEHLEDFARYLDRFSPKPRPVAADHETDLLGLTHWRDPIAVPAVRRTT